MSDFDFDLITIGAGSGGVAAARRAASYGAKVAICEEDRIGGTCVLRGCVPKKLLVYGAALADELHDAAGLGWELGSISHSWARLQQNKDAELDRLSQSYVRRLSESGVQTFAGRARLVDANTVSVGEKQLRGRNILVATGSWPLRPAVPGAELGITSNEALSLPSLPQRLVVVGGGYIAVEMACIFAAFGVAVTVLLRGALPLRGFDEQARAHLAGLLSQRGIRLVANQHLSAIVRNPDGSLTVSSQPSDGSPASEPIATDQVLLATGRAPNTDGLGLLEVGVSRSERGAIIVNEHSRSSVPNIYAIGDCTDRVNLTPIAVAEGRALAETLYNGNPTTVSHAHVPTAVFSLPPLACVGLTEHEAEHQHGPPDIYTAAFKPMKYALGGRSERTFMKLVVDAKSQRVLGCHMVGPDAPEIIQCLAVALTAGATKADFDRTLALHPTAAEEWVLLRERRQ